MDDPEFVALMEKVRAGNQEAVATLLRAYEPEVRMMIRSRLPQILRKRFDSQDLAQSVWISLLIGPDGGGRLEFATPGQFLAYVAGVAHYKVLEKYRRHTRTKKYELAREEPLDLRTSAGSKSRRIDEPASPEPTPSQYIQAADLL
jgi:DNA-directed RNA polymerase specialized sigma24 family protein